MPTKVGESGITFPVHAVEKAKDKLACSNTRYAVNNLLTHIEQNRAANILSCSGYNSTCVNGITFQPLIAAAHLAFSEHRPLVLSPDMIWITIVQGFAQHVKNNAEKLRFQFVDHAGKMELSCEREDLFENSPESAWDKAIMDLAAKLELQMGPVVKDLMVDFSTTGPIERAACAVSLLDAFQPYFEYVVFCICGIPEITLEGRTNDWEALRKMIDNLQGYSIDWWIPHLQKIADQFVRASAGDIDQDHWQDIYKQKKAYGWDLMNGWLLELIPYVRHHETGLYTEKNPLCQGTPERLSTADQNPVEPGLISKNLPGGISMAPFKLVTKERTLKMQFLGGFLGIEQNQETLALRPKLGWAVRREPEAAPSEV